MTHPLTSFDAIGCFGALRAKYLIEALRAVQVETGKEFRLRTLMPSILDKAFEGEL